MLHTCSLAAEDGNHYDSEEYNGGVGDAAVLEKNMFLEYLLSEALSRGDGWKGRIEQSPAGRISVMNRCSFLFNETTKA